MNPILLGVLLFAAAILVTSVLAIRRQRRALGHEAPGWWMPLRSLRWSGALVASVVGPLLFAKMLVMVLALGSEVLLPAEGAGMMAGIGVAWLVLPMALLVIGTAALKLPAAADDRTLDTRDVIRLADGNEWSLLPLGVGLALGVSLLIGAALGVAMGTLAYLPLLPLGMALLVWISGRLAGRYQSLSPPG
ncbi:MAG: hypothetical protein JJT88_20585 [Gammaproteobacteria bacterium]|jgi:hypothetical protein|nr:hypothetical protein [Gammaproteobacteria bacterium]